MSFGEAERGQEALRQTNSQKSFMECVIKFLYQETKEYDDQLNVTPSYTLRGYMV